MRGLRVHRIEVGLEGLQHDREWMVVNAAGRFQSQRTLPAMALAQPVLTTHGVTLTFPGQPDVEVPIVSAGDSGAVRMDVSVWEATIRGAVDQGDEAAAWLQEVFGEPGLRLVRMDEVSRLPLTASLPTPVLSPCLGDGAAPSPRPAPGCRRRSTWFRACPTA